MELSEGLYRPKYRDPKTGELKESAIIWARYYRNGRKIRVSTETSNEREAKRFREKCVGGRKPVTTAVRRTGFEDLYQLVVDNYELEGHRSVRRIKEAFAHLRSFFANDLAREIGTERIHAYIKYRRKQNASNATINRELCALRRGYNLAAKTDPAPLVDFVPAFPHLKEASARKGFFERAELDAVLAHLPEYLKAPMFTAFVTGWRVPSEVLSRQRAHLNLEAGVLRLEPNESKTDEPREFMVDMVPELREVLERQLAATREFEIKTGKVVPWLFHNRGHRIRNYYPAWHEACRLAGLKRVPHDFRRSAVRTLIRAGVPTQVAKLMTGHKTDSVFERYGIIDENMRREATEKYAAHLEKERHQAATKVVALKARSGI